MEFKETQDKAFAKNSVGKMKGYLHDATFAKHRLILYGICDENYTGNLL